MLVHSAAFQIRPRQCVVVRSPEHIQVQVVLSCKYIGLLIGHSARECPRAKPVAKFAPRAREVRQTGLTFAKNSI
eukprot:5480707-Pyramimonas_sp.AAC.1